MMDIIILHIAQAAKPYFLYGQHLAGTYEQTRSGGSQENPTSSLCANPTANPVDLNALQFTYAVPEPSSGLLLLVGGALLTLRRKRLTGPASLP